VAVDPSTYLRRPTLVTRARTALRVVTSVGWFTLVLAVSSWIVGWALGWDEFMLIATAAGLCLVMSVLWIFGRATLDVDVEVQPQRVTVGERSAGQMTVVNAGSHRLLPLRMELTVGEATADFDLPTLATGAEHEELFVLPTERRAIIPVGPATSVRGDPLGLLRRAVPWTEPVPLIVHPRISHLGHLGAGLLRDLEGQTTPDLSPADIAFHALRDYEPGDDRRFVHWLTTARVGKLVVRQFTDTRRAHLALVTDGDPRSYADPDEFETAISVTGSFGVRALADDQEVTATVAGHQIPAHSGQSLLDALAAAETSPRHGGLLTQADRLSRRATGISLAIIVTGSRPSIADLREVTIRFGVDVRTMVVRIDHGGATGFRVVGTSVVLTLAALEDLPRLLWAVTQS
jgi:uncharacterized protein (DUF58 family)